MVGEWSADMMLPVLENQQIPAVEIAQSVRLAVKPSATALGVINGGWWPRSRDPAAELPVLIAAVDRPREHVERVAISVPAWTSAPRKLRVGGRRVPLDWFHSWDAHMIRLLIGSNRRPMDLLVISPETSEDTAIAALARAADPDNTDAWPDILTAAGADVEGRSHSRRQHPATGLALRIPLPHWTERIEEDNWESEGGRIKQFKLADRGRLGG
jgi:Family of unknown function (DUF5994)